jgi:hypothetical protein
MKLTSYDYKGKRRFDIHIDGKNVAFAVVIPDAGLGQTWLSDLFVKKGYRGQGLVSKLMAKVFEEFPGKIYLRASSHYDEPKDDNELVDMYKKYGFKEVVGRPKGYMVKESKSMLTLKQYILLEASADPFIKFYKEVERGLIPDVDTADRCLEILKFYYQDYLRWYDAAPHRLKDEAQRRIYRDYQKQLINIDVKLKPTVSPEEKMIAVDQGISQWHYDYPVIAHMSMEAGADFEDMDEADLEERKWEEVGDILFKLGKVPRESPYRDL